MSSSSGRGTNGRPPYIGRNSIPMPGFNDVDLRLARTFAIHEGMSLAFGLDAFNVVNQTIVQGVNSTYSALYGRYQQHFAALGQHSESARRRAPRPRAPRCRAASAPIPEPARTHSTYRRRPPATSTARANCSSRPSSPFNRDCLAHQGGGFGCRPFCASQLQFDRRSHLDRRYLRVGFPAFSELSLRW